MTSPNAAVARVRYVTGLSDTPQHTPNTISGGPDRVYSYRMEIARKNADGTWSVVPYDNGPSATTKRHIRACWEALGIEPKDRRFTREGGDMTDNEPQSSPLTIVEEAIASLIISGEVPIALMRGYYDGREAAFLVTTHLTGGSQIAMTPLAMLLRAEDMPFLGDADGKPTNNTASALEIIDNAFMPPNPDNLIRKEHAR